MADDRYAKARALPEWGPSSQAAVSSASVLVVGAGALGSPVASYLAGAGVGRLGVVDDAVVEPRGLHGQHLHFAPDVGVEKAHSAAAKLGFLNPDVVVEPYQVRFEAANADGLLAGQDLVVDCTNTPNARLVINSACCRVGVPLVTARASGLAGSVLAVQPGVTACLRCASATYPEEAGASSTAPLGPLAGVVGSLQALMALRLLGSTGAAADAGDFLRVSLRALDCASVPLSRWAACPDCGDR